MKIIIEDLNYIVAHEELNPSHIKAGYSSNLYSLLKCIKVIIYYGIRAIPSFFNKDYYQKFVTCKYAFFAFTGNNYRALAPVQEKIEYSSIYKYEDLPFRRVWAYALIFFPLVIIKYFRSSGYMKKAFASEFISFSCSYGYYIEAKKILKKINPSLVIVANDHSLPQRAFFRAAQSLNIKTAYVQHASVSENFPPLEFDYVFLDGQESLDKYTANNKTCKSKIYLYGNPRFDIINSLNTEITSSNNKCGIAINAVDFPDRVAKLIQKLHQDIENISITIRPHPAMDQHFWNTFADKNKCLLSNAKIENPFEFIAHNDFFISGESSFHLDVALTGKTSFFYNFTDKPTLDHYSYIKNKLIKKLPDNLLQLKHSHSESNSEDRIKLVQYYVANYQTPEWGKSAILIASKLEEFSIQNSDAKTKVCL